MLHAIVVLLVCQLAGETLAHFLALPLPGPVFVHEERCEPYREDAGFPADFRRVPLTFNAYGKGRVLRAQEAVTDGNVEPTIAELLARPDVDYLHVRLRSAGCYLARIERAAPEL